MANNKKYIIISGEYSGDIYGSLLVQELKKINSNSLFWGVGGKNMKEQNVSMLADMEDLSIIGFTASILKIKKLKQLMESLCVQIKKINPDHIVLIDFPGFNLSLAKKIKMSNNIPISFFISPTIWAWGEKRINYVKKFVDQMLVIFPFEEKYYKDRGYDRAKFIGHPFFNRIQTYDKNNVKNELGIKDKNIPLVGIFPGSRTSELNKHMPLFIESINLLNKKGYNYQFGIGLASNFDETDFKNKFGISNITINTKDPFKLLMCSDIAVATSGTITLESSFMLTPCVVIYKLSFISWILAKCLLKTKYISMTNILLNKPVLRELVQYKATPENIADAIVLYMNNKEKIKKELKEVLDIYHNGHDAIQNASELIYNYE